MTEESKKMVSVEFELPDHCTVGGAVVIYVELVHKETGPETMIHASFRTAVEDPRFLHDASMVIEQVVHKMRETAAAQLAAAEKSQGH